ncbi:c-type cytochrome domain-containing protein [Gemmata sp. JC717]|uniref:c-type cytochrome domain-containing protein n=1 Tax=Gemmata algarum TaxID=2975278 RepID=UPI0021BA4DDB|nr:c-type cytochrome domain-containing protein [Gemmata algarum]MDY3555607.1 c-type cytochrome domain-containing protein [Gemmata algarum]
MLRHRYCACVLCAVAALIASYLLLFSDLPAANAQKPVSFINDVAPIFKENCFACHDSKKKSGKYDMTTYEKIRAGGTGGDPIVPGKPDQSEFHALLVTTDQRRMPPRDKGEAVPKGKADLVERWIKEGAKLDAGIDPKADLVKELRVRWQPPAPPKAYPFAVIVNALAFTPDSKSVVVGGHHELTVWDATTGKLTKRVRTRSERAYGLAFLPDGKLAVAGGRPGQEGDVRIYDLAAKGKAGEGSSVKGEDVEVLDGVNDPKVLVKHLFDVEDSVLCLAVTPDGKTLAAGGCDRAVRVFDLSEGLDKAKPVQTVENHADWVLGCTISADGKYLLTAGRDKTAKVWDLKAKESVVTFPEHQNIVYGVAVKADGSAGYSVGADKQLRTWKPNGEGKQVKNAGGHGDEVFKVVANPKQPLLATSSADKTVRLWNMDTLAAGKSLAGLTDYVYTVAFSPDGDLVAGGSYDGSVAVWNVKTAAVVKVFNASPGLAAKEPEPKKK